MTWTIYKITNAVNNKNYIGITVQKLKARLNGHSQAWKRSGRNVPSCLGFAIKKHGKENFFMEAIDFADSAEEALTKETFYINLYNSLTKNGRGYNVIENSVTNEPSEESLSSAINTRLQRKKIKKNLSRQDTKFIGVHFLQEKQRWAWSFNCNGKKVFSKNFSTDLDAALDRDISLVEYFAEKYCLQVMNFPENYQKIKNGELERPQKELKISLKASRYNFVNFEKEKGYWRARVSKNQKQIATLSGFKTQEEAAEAADYLNMRSLGDESKLNFPEKKELYLSPNYKIPIPVFYNKCSLPYRNISLEEKKGGKVYYRISLEHKGNKHRDCLLSLEAAIKRRDELRAQYGLQPAIDFPELF